MVKCILATAELAQEGREAVREIGGALSVIQPEAIASACARILIVILLFTFAYRFVRACLARVIKRRIARAGGTSDAARQLETAGKMLQSIVFYVFVIFGLITVLGVLGVNIGALAASAGIAGAAIVLVSQKIIVDWANGLFILVERQFCVGDYVRIGDQTGEVQSITVRHTVIKTDKNEVVIIPNGSIGVVINYMREPVIETLDVLIEDPARLDEGKTRLLEACAVTNEKYAHVLQSPCAVLGVQNVSWEGVTMRLSFQCPKADSFSILRALREECLRHLQEINH